MSVGAIGSGINNLLNRLSSVGPQGPQGPGSATPARPPIEGIKPLPQRPNFQQRYQQDSFEAGPRRQGGGRGGGGLPDLFGGQQRGGGGAQAQDQSQKKGPGILAPDAREIKDPQKAREAAEDQKKSKPMPLDVFMFQKGKQPQKAKPNQQPQKAKPQQKAEKPKEPELGPAFKPKMVKGQMQVVRQTMAERIQEAPAGQKPDDVAAAAAAQKD